MPKYTASKQKGTPGHCFAAQVFKDGKAFIAIEPTLNPDDATRTAEFIAAMFNMITKIS